MKRKWIAALCCLLLPACAFAQTGGESVYEITCFGAEVPMALVKALEGTEWAGCTPLASVQVEP